MFPQTHIITE